MQLQSPARLQLPEGEPLSRRKCTVVRPRSTARRTGQPHRGARHRFRLNEPPVLALFTLCLLVGSVRAESADDPIAAALSHPSRTATDRERDPLRKPAEVLTFAGLRPGMTVADLMAGAGWYTEIVARVVGPSGTVYAHNNAISSGRYGDQLAQRLAAAQLDNVKRLDADLEAFDLPQESVDLTIMALFYHDTYWMNVDRAAMNRRIYESLRPGGIFLVIDHAAKAGAGSAEVKRLHRIEEELVRRELTGAGFVLDAASDILRNPEDDRTENVFDDRIRGRTDRFILRFRKPASEPKPGNETPISRARESRSGQVEFTRVDADVPHSPRREPGAVGPVGREKMATPLYARS